MGETLQIDRIRCDGHGLCAELLPEMIRLDDWGYPIIKDMAVPAHLTAHAQRDDNPQVRKAATEAIDRIMGRK